MRCVQLCFDPQGQRLLDVAGEDAKMDQTADFEQTVIPGFEYSDHDFLTRDKFEELVTEEQARELGWLIREDGDVDESEL